MIRLAKNSPFVHFRVVPTKDPEKLAEQRRKRAAYARELRARRKEAGLCSECGAPRVGDDPLFCPRHRERSRTSARRSYRIRHGIPDPDAPVFGTHHRYPGAGELKDETPTDNP